MQRGLHNRALAWMVGILCVGFSCQTTLSTNMHVLWQYVKGVFFFRLCGKVIQHVSNPRRENAWTHLHLSPPCFLHLDNSKTFILAKCRKTNFPRIKYILQQAGNWIKLWEVPSQHHFTAVYSNRLLRWIQSKTGTNLLVQSPRSSQAPEAKRVCQAPNTANIVYSGTKKYFSTNKMHCQSVSPSFF